LGERVRGWRMGSTGRESERVVRPVSNAEDGLDREEKDSITSNRSRNCCTILQLDRYRFVVQFHLECEVPMSATSLNLLERRGGKEGKLTRNLFQHDEEHAPEQRKVSIMVPECDSVAHCSPVIASFGSSKGRSFLPSQLSLLCTP